MNHQGHKEHEGKEKGTANIRAYSRFPFFPLWFRVFLRSRVSEEGTLAAGLT